MYEKLCPFCNHDSSYEESILGNFPHLAMFGVSGRPDLYTPIETDQLFTMPDVEPCHSGGLHFLIIPKKHVNSLASVPEATIDIAATYSELERIFRTSFIILEHGGSNFKDNSRNIESHDQDVKISGQVYNSRNGRDGILISANPVLKDPKQQHVQSIGHAHAHCIAVENGEDTIAYFRDFLLRMGIKSQIIEAKESPVATLREIFGGRNYVEYIFAQLGRKALIAFDNGEGFPSLLGQTAMSKKEGKPTNWKSIPHDDDEAACSARRLMRTMDQCRFRGLWP